MQIHFGTDLIRPEWNEAVLCIGTFDGVHRGHQAVIQTAVREALAYELPVILVTFDRHPAAVLAPDRCPPALCGMEENLKKFADLGIGITVVLPFDRQLSQMSAQDFLTMLQTSLKGTRVVVGHDFAMGQGREGNAAWLSDRLPTTIVEPFEVNGKRVSSSEIRSLIQEGKVEAAADSLGLPFTISGVVVPGYRLGRQLGYPTANIARSINQTLPKDGVYACQIRTPYGEFGAALSVGTRPAVQGTTRTIEAYILDYPGDSLYGMPVQLQLHRFLREEMNFPTLESLKEQITSDVEWVRKNLIKTA